MSVILLLVIVGILVAGGFLIAFIWAVRNGQYDDSYSPSVRILFDHPEKDTELKDDQVAESKQVMMKVEPKKELSKSNHK